MPEERPRDRKPLRDNRRPMSSNGCQTAELKPELTASWLRLDAGRGRSRLAVRSCEATEQDKHRGEPFHAAGRPGLHAGCSCNVLESLLSPNVKEGIQQVPCGSGAVGLIWMLGSALDVVHVASASMVSS